MRALLRLAAVAALSLSVAAPDAAAQVETFRVTFDADAVGAAPETVSGLGGLRPIGLFGAAEQKLRVQPLFGDVGASSASGNVAVLDAPTAGDYHLIDFDGALLSGLVTSGIVRVGFDIAADGARPGDGFAFLRAYDETGEDIGAAIVSFSESGFSVGLLDYDPATGDFLGILYPDDNDFGTDTWHRVELTYDLDQSTIRLALDGVDGGIEAGMSRATGTGFWGAFFNWGSAYAGRSALDTITIEVPEEDGLPAAPPGFLALLEPETYGGTVLRPENGDFRQRGVAFDNDDSLPLVWAPVYDGVATYRLVIANDGLDEADARPDFVGFVPVQVNRTYEVSALIRADFPRETWELNVIAYGVDPGVANLEGGRYGGMPAVTDGPDGWERWTWRFTPHWPTAESVRLALGIHEYGPGFDDGVSFEIADFAVVELPAFDLAAFAPGEGVTFPGGPGALGMAVTGVEESGDVLAVTTTAARFAFDRAAGTLAVEQRLNGQRELALVTGLDLAGLAVQTWDEGVAVLGGTSVTVGVQADGTAVISPHSELVATVESRIGGDFNRIARGDLFSTDDWGGFTANVHVPLGTGRAPRLALQTAGLAFDGLPPDDLTTTGAADPGWTARADVSPGERLFVSAFPTREYDWEKSFDFVWSLVGFGEDIDPADYSDDIVTDYLLWNVTQRAWGMSFGPRYEPREGIPYLPYAEAAEAAGKRWLIYASQWFYFSRDPETFAGEAMRWRDEYGMDGIYSDGLAQDDWLSAYVLMRRLRGDVFPEGSLIIHDSFPQSGVAAAAFRPFIYGYATATYMAENAVVDAGADWAWVRYVTSQHGRANAFGVTKGDGWAGFEGVEKYLVGLVWGGRGYWSVGGFDTEYIPKLLALRDLWQEAGDDPFFFDRFYHPEAQELTGYKIGRVGMPIMETEGTGGVSFQLASWTPDAEVRYTTDGTDPTAESELYTAPFVVAAGVEVRARAFKPGQEPSRIASSATDLGVWIEPEGRDDAAGVLALDLPFPNPAAAGATVRYRLPAPGPVRLEAFDVLGRRVAVLAEGERPAGPHAARFNAAALAPGVYVLRLDAGDQVLSRRVTVVR